MTDKQSITSLLAALLLVATTIAPSQEGSQKSTLIINGQSTNVPVIQVNGHSYAGLEALAEAVKGSVSYSGNMIALSVPIRAADTASSAAESAAPVPAPAQSTPPNEGFSREFLNAGIEQMSTLREWHAALATALQSGIPVTAALLAPYRAQATRNLHLALVAARTPSDRSAYDLLNNVFQNMAELSDKYVNARTNMSYVSPDALRNEPLNERIIACGRSLEAMAASGQFVDDGSCH